MAHAQREPIELNSSIFEIPVKKLAQLFCEGGAD